MTEYLIAEVTDTAIPLNLTINQAGAGGVTGKNPIVRIRDASTTNSYLDFSDNTFKIAGWTTQDGALTEVERGHYQRSFDATAVGALAAGDVLALEYHVDDGADVVGDDHDLLHLVASIHDIPFEVWNTPLPGTFPFGSAGEKLNAIYNVIGSVAGLGAIIVTDGLVYKFNDFSANVALPNSGTAAQRRIAFDADTIYSGKVYIESDLSVLYVLFGDATVNANATSIRLVGGAPWTIATSGLSHMSIYATSDVNVGVRGLVSV